MFYNRSYTDCFTAGSERNEESWPIVEDGLRVPTCSSGILNKTSSEVVGKCDTSDGIAVGLGREASDLTCMVNGKVGQPPSLPLLVVVVVVVATATSTTAPAGNKPFVTHLPVWLSSWWEERKGRFGFDQ